MKLRNVKEGKTMPYVLWVLDGDDRQWKMYKGVNDARKFVAENDYDDFLDQLNTRVFPNGTYYNNYIDWVVIPAGEDPKSFDTHKFYNSIKTESKKISVKESYSDIWSDNAWDAYDIAMEYLGAEGLCEALAKAMGTDELANKLKYIFRVNEIPFMDDEDEDEEEFDEGCGRKKKKSKKQVKESQASSAAYYDFQEFLGKLEEFIDDNNILFSIKGTKFAGEGADTFEIILSSAYENEEVTTIIIEHSNRNYYNAWTATYDFDGDYDDASATYIDDLYDDVTSWIERAAAVAG